MIKNKRLIVLISFFSLFTVFFAHKLSAQQAAPAAEPAAAANSQEEPESPAPLTPERQRIEMEIRTSTLPELAAWCRTLGLAESGTREEITARLREHFELPRLLNTENEQKVIIVNSAQTSEYFKIDEINEEYARLKGDVSISLVDGDHIHNIVAEEVLFNRTRNTLTARGGVVYTKTAETDGAVETFRGENITVNIDTWAAVFLDGDSKRALTGDDITYKFTGTVISRTDEDTTILKNALITNADQEEPYWSITASKLWLLPGSDFAFFNGVLKVGEIPLLWLPFFYYPADELIFHPVIGYRSREGGFVQTTTYIMGRPKANEDEQSSITSILGSAAGMDTERQGIFLRSTGRKTVNPNETSLRFLLDHYVNMGTFTGVDFSLPQRSVMSKPFLFSLGIGFTRTVELDGGSWTPYSANGYDGSFDWNKSDFFSNQVPFRYKLNLEGGVNFRYGNVSWELPYYSDPYVNRDFYDYRSESMDWFNIMQEGITSTTSSASSLGAPQWKLFGSITPNINILSPYVSRVAITSFSSTLTFKILTNPDSSISPYSPTRDFVVPDSFTIYNLSASISGNPLSVGRQNPNYSGGNQTQTDNPLADIGEPVSPWENDNTNTERIAIDDIIVPPPIDLSFTLPGDGNIIFGINYNIYPASSSVLQFRSGYNNWNNPDQVNWNEIQSILTSVSGNADVNFRLDHSDGLFSNVFTISGTGSWRDFTYLNEEAEAYRDPQNPSGTPKPEMVDETRRILQYAHTRYASQYNYIGTVRPFLNDSIFNQTNFQYNLKGTLVSSKRYDKDTSPDGPELTPVWGKWERENINKDIYGLVTHQFTTNLSAFYFNRQQTLSLSSNLPPLDPSIYTNATFNIWYSSTNVNFRIRRIEEDATYRPGEWFYEPINISETLRFPNNNAFTLSLVIDPEDNNDITNIITSVTLWNSSFRTQFNARKTQRVSWNDTFKRWDEYGDRVLQPEKLSISYERGFQDRNFFNNRVNFSFSIFSSLTFDLIKYTNSNFLFRLGPVKLLIPNILEFSISASSDNSVIFRYFKNVPGIGHLAHMYPDGRQNNVFLDLIDSFNFFDDNARRRSGFKARSLNLTLTHFLGDWEAVLNVEMYPHLNRRIPEPYRYELVTDIGFIVQWRPISQIKTDLKYDGQQNRWSSN